KGFYHPEQIKVSIRDNDLIVQGEHNYKDDTRSEKLSFYNSVTLPLGTQMEQLKSQLTPDGKLQIEAPFYEPTLQQIEMSRR
ncbi:unnamed protein product, partial [Didymodactylos carnosus]